MVYRAVRAEAFRRVDGFDDIGYLDDQTLAAKLGEAARFVETAVCYHYNPATLGEVFSTGSWRGKTIWHQRRWGGLRDYFPVRSLARGFRAAVRHKYPPLAVYSIVLEGGIFWGVLKRALGIDITSGA